MAEDWPVQVSTVGEAATGARVWRSPRAKHLTVVVKALFAFKQNSLAVLSAGAVVNTKERHYGDSPRRSMEEASDLAPYRARCDVTLQGHACAPDGQSVQSQPVRLAIVRTAPILDKRLVVVGDRGPGGALQPFQHIPIDYEHAYGGKANKQNPVGRGADTSGSQSMPPNVVDPANAQRVVGFGPLSRYWGDRARLLGAHPRKDIDADEPSIPEGFDWSYFQTAPQDQQIAYLAGDEWIVLEGMHPKYPRLSTQLPSARGAALLYGLSGQPQNPPTPLSLVLDTLAIDADRTVVAVVWRGSVVLPETIALRGLRVVGAVQIGGAAIAWPTAQSAADLQRAPSSAPSDQTVGLSAGDALRAIRSAATPFSPSLEAEAPAAGVPSRPSPDSGMTIGVTASPAAPRAPAPAPASAPAPAPPSFDGTIAASPGAALRAIAPFALAEAGARTPPSAEGTPFARAAQSANTPIEPPPLSTPYPAPANPPISTPYPAPANLPISTPYPAPANLPISTPYPAPANPPIAAAPVSTPPPLSANPLPAPAAQPPAQSDIDQTFKLSAKAADRAASRAAIPFRSLEPDEVAPAPVAIEPAPRSQRTSEFGSTISVRPEDLQAILEQIAPFPITRPKPRPIPKDGVPPRESPQVPIVVHPPGLQAATTPWQLEPPADVLAIVVKGTFDLVQNGPAATRAESEPLSGDVFADDDPGKSLTYPTDFAITKPRADVLLVGHAVAPSPGARTAQVRFRFGERGTSRAFERALTVVGDRIWQRGVPGEPQPFERIPLVWERAFGGGPDFGDNPVGTGRYGSPPPNLEDPNRLLRSQNDVAAPACFAALSPHWTERLRKLGTYDDVWFETRWPYYPKDFDTTHFQAAPRGQQVEHLRGDEPYSLSGVAAEDLAGSLPGIRVRAFRLDSADAGGAFTEVAMALDTAIFDSDKLTLTLLWRGLVRVADDEAPEIETLFIMSEPLSSTPLELDACRRVLFRVAADEPDEPPPDPEPPRRLSDKENAALHARVSTTLTAGEPLDDFDFAGSSFVGFDFSGRSLVGANFKDAVLRGCRFAGATLTEAVLASADLADADLTGAKLAGADLTGAVLERAKLDEAALDEADLTLARCEGASFRGATGDSLTLVKANCVGVSFERAKLPSADFTEAKLDKAVFSDAELKEIKLYFASGEGARFDRADMTEARADDADLVKSSFKDVKAPSSVFEKSFLAGSTFSGAELTGASFTRASCEGVNFSQADAKGVRFSRAKLKSAQFAKANLMEADFERADLTDVDLRSANLHGAETWKATLRGTKLEQAIVTQSKLAGRAPK
ncbi:MAG: DUF2169 domain-containing protein [Polyangiaceae bacterium]